MLKSFNWKPAALLGGSLTFFITIQEPVGLIMEEFKNAKTLGQVLEILGHFERLKFVGLAAVIGIVLIHLVHPFEFLNEPFRRLAHKLSNWRRLGLMTAPILLATVEVLDGHGEAFEANVAEVDRHLRSQKHPGRVETKPIDADAKSHAIVIVDGSNGKVKADAIAIGLLSPHVKAIQFVTLSAT